MWFQLGLFGSRVVEAVSVGATSEDKGAGTLVDSLESPSPAGARMEGNDVTALIAARMGIDPSDVTAKLVSLHQKNELDGAGGPPVEGTAGPQVPVEDEEQDVSLTLGVLEEFERSEAAAAEAVLAPATPSVKLRMKPAVLGAPTPSKSFASAASRQAEMEDEPVVDLTKPSSSSLKWCEDDVAMEPEEDRARGEHESEVTAMEPEEDRAYGEHEAEVWPEPRRYGKAREAEAIYGSIAPVAVSILASDSLSLSDLQGAMLDVVAQVNVANKALATAGHVTAERSREAIQQAKISSDLATEALLKSFEVAAVAASSARQSWKMCVQMSGPDMPARSKEAERKTETTGRYLASKMFGVTLKAEEVAIAHFRGAHSNDFIIGFTRTGSGSSYEALLHASKAMVQNRISQVYAKIMQANIDMEM
jgi:hypothetical protein